MSAMRFFVDWAFSSAACMVQLFGFNKATQITRIVCSSRPEAPRKQARSNLMVMAMLLSPTMVLINTKCSHTHGSCFRLAAVLCGVVTV